MTRLVVAAVALLLFPGAAAAAPVPVADGFFAPSTALVGDRVVALEIDGRGGTVVKAFPAAGGPGTRLAEIGTSESVGRLAASPTQVAALVDGTVVAGPVTAPLRRVTAPAGLKAVGWTGETLLLATASTVTTVAPDGTRGSWPLPEDAQAETFTAAGPYAAVFVLDTDNPGVAVLDGATGRERYFAETDFVRDLALQDDGTIAVIDEGTAGRQDVAWSSLADPRPHSLPRPNGEMLAVGLSGGRIVVSHVTRRLGAYAAVRLAAGPLTTGPRTALGAPWVTQSAEIDDLALLDGRVATTTFDCLVTTSLGDPVSRALPAGPCARSQSVPVALAGSSRVGADRRVPVRVACVAAPGAACSGALTVTRSRTGATVAKGRYRVARGATRTVRLSPTALGRRMRGRQRLFVADDASDRFAEVTVVAPSR